MKLGLNTFLFASPFTTAAAKTWLPRFAAWGFDGVELAIEDASHVDARVVRRIADDHGLAILAVCGAFGPGRDLRGTPAEQQASLDYVCAMLDQMGDLGAPVFCGPLYSAVGRAQAESSAAKAQQWELVQRHLSALAADARARGKTIALEPLNRFETDFINTAAQALEMIKAVNNPALGIHLDTFHMNIEEKSSPAAIRLVGRHLKHLHACGCDRGTPGHDHIDWPGIRAALADVEYDGSAVIESFTPAVEVIARAAAIWRDIEPSPETIAQEGLAFLRAWRNGGSPSRKAIPA